MASKKYSINWENDEPVSFEVNGVLYQSLDQIADEADRGKLSAMMDGSSDYQFEQEFTKELEAHQKTSASAEKLILAIFSGVAVVMLLIAFVSSANAILKMTREESAPGRVVEIIERREYVNQQDRVVQEYYYPVVEFVSGDARFHSVQMIEGSSALAHEVGTKSQFATTRNVCLRPVSNPLGAWR